MVIVSIYYVLWLLSQADEIICHGCVYASNSCHRLIYSNIPQLCTPPTVTIIINDPSVMHHHDTYYTMFTCHHPTILFSSTVGGSNVRFVAVVVGGGGCASRPCVCVGYRLVYIVTASTQNPGGVFASASRFPARAHQAESE